MGFHSPFDLSIDDLTARAEAATLRHPQPFSLISADIDALSEVDLRHGQGAKDAVSAAVLRVLVREFRAETDIVARIARKAFVVVLPHTDLWSAKDLAERSRSSISDEVIRAGSALLRVTASFGVSLWRGEEAFSDALTRADEALYRAKHRGRDMTLTEADWPGDCALCILPRCSNICGVSDDRTGLVGLEAARLADLARDPVASLAPQITDDVPIHDRPGARGRDHVALPREPDIVVYVGGADDE